MDTAHKVAKFKLKEQQHQVEDARKAVKELEQMNEKAASESEHGLTTPTLAAELGGKKALLDIAVSYERRFSKNLESAKIELKTAKRKFKEIEGRYESEKKGKFGSEIKQTQGTQSVNFLHADNLEIKELKRLLEAAAKSLADAKKSLEDFEKNRMISDVEKLKEWQAKAKVAFEADKEFRRTSEDNVPDENLARTLFGAAAQVELY